MSGDESPGPGEIWLGDLARAAHVLGIADADRLRAAAGLLGLDAAPARSVAPVVAADAPAGAPVLGFAGVRPTAGPDPGPDTGSDGPPARAPAPPGRFPALPEVVRIAEQPAPRSADAWHGVERVPEAGEHHLTARPRHVSLLPPRSQRAILQTVLSRPFPDGKVDLPALVDRIARGLPVRELPRQSVPTSRFGVQVLVDLGRAMAPFAADQRALVEQVRAVVGKHATEVRHFADSPLRGVWGDDDVAGPYHPPAPGCRVLLLSDLGLGGPRVDRDRSRHAEWSRFTTILRWHGCSPIGLVPFPPARWPGWLRGLLPLVCWDRTTTVSRARAGSSWG
ncbi:hypothetical protein [Saccharothrix australiensis]|uniref:Uncharacterized protein n=1 Tax=Saccharothrix australiensis TaxID=2072 RepID=A0A495W131_9PSEU|nr:hypothetical protein [Saccharothrix australiensis]RKT55401.1 hypothetical protein C8E97_4069 [Saccharothrix australiensis]